MRSKVVWCEVIALVIALEFLQMTLLSRVELVKAVLTEVFLLVRLGLEGELG